MLYQDGFRITGLDQLLLSVHGRFSGIFVNMSLTFQKADAQADLDWWSRNHGTGMPQNWPMFEVRL